MEAAQKDGTTVRNENFKVSLYLSGDWKFLSILLGLGSPNLIEGFCLWCLANKKSFATTALFHLRKMEDALRSFPTCPSASASHKPPGQIRSPLFPFIPYERIIIDPLHAFLRIGEKLIDLAWSEALLTETAICEKCSKNGKCASGCVCTCHRDIKANIVEEMKRLGINHFEFYKNKLTNKLDWTSLQGNEISEVLKNFNLTKILSDARVEVNPQNTM